MTRSGFETRIPVWKGEDPWLHVQRHRPLPLAAHWHSHVEINYLVDCSLTYVSVGQRIHLPAERIALFWAAIPHQVAEVSGPGEIYCIYVSLQEFMSWKLPAHFNHQVMHGNFLASLEEDPGDLIAVNRWWEDWRQTDPRFRRQALEEIQLRLRRMALTGWQLLGDRQHTPVGKAVVGCGRGLAHVEAMVEFIAAHYPDPIGVDEVAGHVGLHPNYALTLFKGVIGLSISVYITRHRLSHAQAMLLNTDRKVIAIAMDCGFRSLSRFYEVFGTCLGTTPRRYREAWFRQRDAGWAENRSLSS